MCADSLYYPAIRLQRSLALKARRTNLSGFDRDAMMDATQTD
jgi:hypothetical protein